MAAISPPGTELRHCRKTFTFNGSAGTGATGTFTSNFTLTGRVVIHKLTAFATTALTTGGGTPTLAMASDSAAWFGTISDARGLAVNTFWNPAGNAANYAVVTAPWESAFTYGNSGELAIKSAPVMTIGGANITGGVLVIDVWYYPITDNGALAGDDIDDTEATRIRAAVGLASANVDTQFSNTYSRIGAPAGASVSADVAATKALLPTALVGGRIDASVGAMASGVLTATAIAADAITAAKIAADAIGASELATDAVTEIVTAVLTTAMTEAYAADGVAPTLAQALFLLISALTEFAISGTTITAKKLDGSTTSATFTINDASNPTSRTRAS